MNKMKKTIIIFMLSLLLTFSILTTNNGMQSSSAVTLYALTVDVSPNNSGKIAEYHIYGTVSGYDGIDIFKIYFRWDTSFENENPSVNSVLVNGVTPLEITFSKTTENELLAKIVLTNELNRGDDIDIKFKKEAGIVNPTNPGICYTVRMVLVSKDISLQELTSKKYAIDHSAATVREVLVEPQISGTNASYSINLETGVQGYLKAGEDSITVYFPEGTSLPQRIALNPKKIKINGAYSLSVTQRDSHVLNIKVPINIVPETSVKIVFDRDFGIKNTNRTGSKKLYVATSSEPFLVESEPFYITEPWVQNLKVSLSSDIIATDSSIHIDFTTSPVGFLIKGKSIYINFPDDFALPELIDSSFVTVNGKNAETEVNGKQIIVHTPENIGNNADVVIEISEEACIANPMSFRDYEIEVHTDNDTYIAVATVSITQSSVKNVVLDALYSGTGTKNRFNITFTTGVAGKLTSGVDYVTVYFGNAFELHETATEGTIFIDDIPVNSVSVDVYSIIATVPFDIEPNSEVQVKIPVDFGIRNPDEIGDYVLKISTSKETAAMESNTLTIVLLPVVEFIVAPIPFVRRAKYCDTGGRA